MLTAQHKGKLALLEENIRALIPPQSAREHVVTFKVVPDASVLGRVSRRLSTGRTKRPRAPNELRRLGVAPAEKEQLPVAPETRQRRLYLGTVPVFHPNKNLNGATEGAMTSWNLLR